MKKNIQCEFDERAGIYEFDGGLSRSEAERKATMEINVKYKKVVIK